MQFQHFAGSRPKILFTLTALLMASSPIAFAAQHPVVVELFTSQGCSSCPPADAVLSELASRDDVIALGFHVDYWDRLGWKDPLSASGATARQNHYATLFGHNEIYTPQIVVDGVKQVVGSNKGAVLQAIAASAPEAKASVAFADDQKTVSIGAGDSAGTVTLVRFIRKRSNAVSHGENAGHVAQDSDAVIEIKSLGIWENKPAEFAIDPPQPGQGLAVLVQTPQGQIVGAGALRAAN